MLYTGAFLFVLFGIGFCPAVALLKRHDVLFGVGLLLSVAGYSVSGVSPWTGTVLVALGVLVWIVAASRRASPGSPWARQHCGDPERRPTPPALLTAGLVAVAVGAIVAGIDVGEPIGLIATGAVLPQLWAVGAGWRAGRAVVTVDAVLLAAYWLVVASGGGRVDRTVFVVGLVLLAAGVAAMFTTPAGTYLRAAGGASTREPAAPPE